MTLFGLSVTPQNIGFMCEVFFHRAWFFLGLNHNPSSAPYLSGDTFRSMATHVYDNDETFSPTALKKGDLVFVGFSHLTHFFEQIHPLIATPYVLITHNGDTTIDASYARFIDSKIIHWFSQNVDFAHPKLTPLPIGLENIDYYNHGIPSLFDTLKERTTEKQPRILYGFSVHTNPVERGHALQYISHHSLAVPVPERLNSRAYLQLLNTYQFVLSPPGNGIDCIRTWEALYLRVIPIVKKSLLTTYFDKLGLPLWVVDSWQELDGYTENQLQEKYASLMKKSDLTALYTSYWQLLFSKYVK